MANELWREDLNRLVARFSVVHACPDTYSMEISELWAFYCRLRRLAQGRVRVA